MSQSSYLTAFRKISVSYYLITHSLHQKFVYKRYEEINREIYTSLQTFKNIDLLLSGVSIFHFLVILCWFILQWVTSIVHMKYLTPAAPPPPPPPPHPPPLMVEKLSSWRQHGLVGWRLADVSPTTTMSAAAQTSSIRWKADALDATNASFKFRIRTCSRWIRVARTSSPTWRRATDAFQVKNKLIYCSNWKHS